MIDINIDDYKDYENVTIAEYVAAIKNVEDMAFEAFKKGNLKTARHYAKVYFVLNKLHGEKIKNGNGLGYKPKVHSK